MAIHDPKYAIERFLSTARSPVLIEPGEKRFPLTPGAFQLERRNERLVLQVWDDTRNLVRKITAAKEAGTGKLELTVERFAKQQGQVLLLDFGRMSGGDRLREPRLLFREQFRQSLQRQFPEWTIAELSSEANLEASLSPAYPRALLRKGGAALAALGAPPEPGAAAGALTFGLIWLDYLRSRERRLTVEGLALFVPEAESRTLCLRLRCLNPRAARYFPFAYSAEGYEEHLDPEDTGNLDTRLDPVATLTPHLPPQFAEWTDRLARLPFVERVQLNGGGVSLRVRGLEFARASAKGMSFGLKNRTRVHEGNLAEIEELARELARLRRPSADRENQVFRLKPEGWLESEVRAHLDRIDPTLYPDPVYGQVPAIAGGERGILDLLAADRSGRLAVLELKASEDIHLPVQALDYWMRVSWHAARDDFSTKGYFPGILLRREPPRLVLVAPALEFHPKTETILRYFAPNIEVERIGIGVEWRQGPAVMFRMGGARRPECEYGEPHLQPDQDSVQEPEPGAGA